ncbi:MAG: CAP domain-containing protein [Monoraphidium minutum]|nr:MAG: CAP domain-containing protein [Monoraphidium minutum]
MPLALAILLGVAASGALAAPNRVLELSKDAILAAHNAHRKAHGADPLAWDDGLRASALRYAQQCTWSHSAPEQRGGAGENLYFANGYALTTGRRAVYAWYVEERDYDYAAPGRPKAGRDNAMIGHFTQIVWRGTKRVGCAAVQCSSMAYTAARNVQYLVCHYSPAGNVLVGSGTTPSAMRYSIQGVTYFKYAAPTSSSSRTVG